MTIETQTSFSSEETVDVIETPVESTEKPIRGPQMENFESIVEEILKNRRNSLFVKLLNERKWKISSQSHSYRLLFLNRVHG